MHQEGRFCVYCGAALTTMVPPAADSEPSNVAVFLGVFVLVVGAVFGLAAINQQPVKHAYGAAAEADFLTGCQALGASLSLCQCGLDKFEEQYDYDTYLRLQEGAQRGVVPQELVGVVEACQH